MDRWGNRQPSIASQCDSVSWQIASANTTDMGVARAMLNAGVAAGQYLIRQKGSPVSVRKTQANATDQPVLYEPVLY